jgi:hypothetical protein
MGISGFPGSRLGLIEMLGIFYSFLLFSEIHYLHFIY